MAFALCGISRATGRFVLKSWAPPNCAVLCLLGRLRQGDQQDVAERAEANKKEGVEGTQVVATNAFPHPGAVMVVAHDAHLAEIAVLAASTGQGLIGAAPRSGNVFFHGMFVACF